MVTELRVVNDCLAIMGEAPLNALAESHAFKAAAQNTLLRVSDTIQSKGWWYNMENITITASPVDGRMYIPNDVPTVLPPYDYPNVVQRGRVLYDLNAGDDVFPQGTSHKMRLIRVLAIDLVPVSVADYITAQVVLEFQNLYDGDQTKTRNLEATRDSLKTVAMSEHIRNRRVNLILTSQRFQRVASTINYTSRPGS
jgi:hypothetical protein